MAAHIAVTSACDSDVTASQASTKCLVDAEHALLKSYNLNREAGVIKLLALLLPRNSTVPAPEDLPSSSM